ncbi:MAG: DUF58 domain-containing protein [Pseudomonadota bacterium]
MSDFVIGRRELYILPTRVGWYFGLILIALFAIAVKYNNQAAFMMLFILSSIGMVAMLYTHNNVIGLGLDSQPSKPVFLGETAAFTVRVVNHSNTHRSAVWLVCDGFHQLIDLPNSGDRQVELKLPTVKRGYLNCSPVILTSRFPIGIFFCWTKRFQPAQRCLVYPQPLNLTAFPESGSNHSERQARATVRAGAEDYSGMKPYQAGDRIRDVHWPSLAKTQKLVTIQHENQSSSTVNLSWFALPPNMDVEDKLSQLCYWVIGADQDNLRYQLEMPNHTVQFNSGMAHFHECLSVLALWSE